MPKFDYSRSVATANRLIDKFGQAGAIRRTTMGGDPWEPTPTDTDYPCTLVVMNFSLHERESTLIGATDKRVYIATEGVEIEPTNSDKIVVDGTAHEIVRISPLNPGGTVVYWEAQVSF